MASEKAADERYFAGFVLLLAAVLVALGVTIFPSRDTVPAPTAATGGSREVPAPGNPPTPAGADTPAATPKQGG